MSTIPLPTYAGSMAAHAHTPGISRSEWIQFAAIGLVAALAFVLEFTHASNMLIFIVAGVAVARMAHVLGIATEQTGMAAGPRISPIFIGLIVVRSSATSTSR